MKPLFLFLLLTILSPAAAYAKDSSLTINPPLIEIEADPPTSLEIPISIKNNSEDEFELDISLRPFTQSGKENGQIQFLSEDDAFPGANKDILEQIAVRENSKKVTSITLLPKEEKKLGLYVGIDEKEPHSDYYFSVVFIPKIEPITNGADEEPSTGSSIKAGIGMNVLLSVGPKQANKGLIDTFSVPTFLQGGPVPFTVRIKNTSSHYITPSGSVLIENMFGQKIGKVSLHKANILAGTTRAFISDDAYKEQLAKQKHQGSISTQNPTLTWPETFLLGPYKATLTVSLSDKGPTLVRETRFYAFPFTLLIGILVTIVILIAVKKRVDIRRNHQ